MSKQTKEPMVLTAPTPLDDGGRKYNVLYLVLGGIGAIFGNQGGGLQGILILGGLGIMIAYTIKSLIISSKWKALRYIKFSIKQKLNYDELIKRLFPILSPLGMTLEKDTAGNISVVYRNTFYDIKYNEDQTFTIWWRKSLMRALIPKGALSYYPDTVKAMGIIGYYVQQICSANVENINNVNVLPNSVNVGIQDNGTYCEDGGRKSSRKLKKILLGVGALVVALVVGIALGSSQESEEKVIVPESESTEELLENESNVEGLKTSKSQLDVIGAITNIGTVDPKFELSNNQTEFIQSHLDLFPASYENLDELSQYIDTTLDYSHMIKNPKDVSGRFAFMEQLTVEQIWEENFGEGDSPYDYITCLNSYDVNGNCYYIYYIGKPTQIVEGDFARVVAMPVEYSSYKNLEGTDVLTLVMVASLVENQETSEITGGYFSDKYQTQASVEIPAGEYMENEPVSNEVPAGNYGSDPSAYAGRYEGAGYTIEFSVGSDIDTDEVGDVCVYYGGNCESEHIPVYTCTSAGDWSISNYDAVYEIREEGNPMYMMFYEANGTVYMDYSSPNRNAGVLELVQRYIS